MKLGARLSRLVKLPAAMIARMVELRVRNALHACSRRYRDNRHTTFSGCLGIRELRRVLWPDDLDELIQQQQEWVSAVSKHYLDHRFDLLGSGWVQIRYGMDCRGLEGHKYNAGPGIEADAQGKWLAGRINNANLECTQAIWRLVDADHEPIDWQLDFKSGYRWSENTWFMRVPLTPRPGADIKVPWELGRMQHLTQLGLAYRLAQKGTPGFSPPEAYLRCFRNQILDFMATNPPRFGVNWRSTMDVAIRVTNWLSAYDLFRCFGANFDEDFERALRRSVYEHALHIERYPEWTPELKGNHYLAGIVGLLFSAGYLPSSEETRRWLRISAQALEDGMKEQFTPDGANFEGSTSYHRLAAEMVVYGTAILLGLADRQSHTLGERAIDVSGDLPFSAGYFKRLEKMAEFVMDITKPNGHIPQIGDNDSGRLLKLQPVYRQMRVSEARAVYRNLSGYYALPDDETYWDEDHIDHRHLVAAVNGLFERADFAKFAKDQMLDTSLIKALSGGNRVPSYRVTDAVSNPDVHIGDVSEFKRMLQRLQSGDGARKSELAIPGKDIWGGLKLLAYPDFGIYVYRSDRVYLAIRCGAVGQNGIGGHAHNDQLAIELNVDGEDWIADPGTYLYTPLPQRRNEYRSVDAHYGPKVQGLELGGRQENLFRLGPDPKARCLYFGREGFLGTHLGYGAPVHRAISLLEQTIRVTDYMEGGGTMPGETCVIEPSYGQISFSPGYGIRYN